jgi:hypothetical protein
MPELSRFYGIVVAMYYRDHGPPHFHAIYGEHEAIVEIDNGAAHGHLPARAMGHVQEWRTLHRGELIKAWYLAREQKPLPGIAPLE